MIRAILFIFILLLCSPDCNHSSAQEADMNLDSIYMSYMSDSSKAQIQKLRNEMDRIEQRQQEHEKAQMWWYLLLAGCALSAVIVTGGIFRAVFQGHDDAPIHRKLSAAVICLCGGVAIFLLDVGWLYMSYEASQKMQKLILFAILLVLGIALWIYTKNLKKENSDNI